MKQNQIYQFPKALRYSQTGGFTLIEAIIVVALVATLAVISAPVWQNWLNTRRLTNARQEIYAAMRLAQQQAMQRQVRWQFSIREGNDRLEWAIHPESVPPEDAPNWRPLEGAVEFDHDNSTLPKARGTYYVSFKFTGDIHYRLGRITLTSSNGQAKRCVIVSTLIGAIRKGENHQLPDGSGRYCY